MQGVALVGWLVGAGAAVESLEVEVLPPAAPCRLGGFFSVVRHIRRKSAMGPYFCMWVDLGKNAKNRSILKPAECPTRYPRVGWYPLFLVFMCAFEALFISVNPFHAAPCSLLATYGAGVRVCLLFACGSRFEVRGSRFEDQQLRRVAGGVDPMPARRDSSPADRLVARLDRRPKGPNP